MQASWEAQGNGKCLSHKGRNSDRCSSKGPRQWALFLPLYSTRRIAFSISEGCSIPGSYTRPLPENQTCMYVGLELLHIFILSVTQCVAFCYSRGKWLSLVSNSVSKSFTVPPGALFSSGNWHKCAHLRRLKRQFANF